MKAKKIVSLLTAVCMVVSLMAAFTITASAAGMEITSYTPESYEPAVEKFIGGKEFDDTNNIDDVITYSSHILTTSPIDADTLVVGCEVKFTSNASVSLRFKGTDIYAINFVETKKSDGSSSLLFRMPTVVNNQFNAAKITSTAYTKVAEINSLTNAYASHKYTFIFEKKDSLTYLKKIYFDGNEVEFLAISETYNGSSTATSLDTTLNVASTPYVSTLTWEGAEAIASWKGGYVNLNKASGVSKQVTAVFKKAYVYIPKTGIGVETLVTKPSYLPAAENVIIDENFDNSTLYTSSSGSTTVSSTYKYSFKNYTIGHGEKKDSAGTVTASWGLMDGENGNKYILGNQWGNPASRITGPFKDADTFIVSFDCKPVAGGFNLYFGGKATNMALRFDFGSVTGDNSKVSYYLGQTASGTRLTKSSDINITKDAFHTISCIIKRINVNGKYKAVLSKTYLDNKELELSDIAATAYLNQNWWSVAAGNSTVLLGNFSAYNIGIDNVLAYTPVGASSAVSGEITGELTAGQTLTGTIFNLPENAGVILACYGVDEEESYLIDAAVSAERTVTLTIPENTAPVKAKLFVLDYDGNPLMEAVEF